MWPIIPPSQTLAIIAILFVIAIASVRLLQPEWWQARAVRIAVLGAFATMLSGVAVWTIGCALGRPPMLHTGVAIAYAGVLIAAPAVVVLPLAALVDRLAIRALARTSVPAADVVAAPTAQLSRRAFIRAGSATLPALGALTGASGFASARQAPRIRVIPMRYEDLHPDLDGLRILQLSDLHLGAYASLDDLAKGLDAAIAAQHPDLIVLTGDLADVPSLIPGALELVARAKVRYGAIASLGNHEYLHGIEVTRPLYEASRVPLLVSAGRTLTIGRARLFIGGADDPVHMAGDIASMLTPSIVRAAAQAPAAADFRLLLCHRPEGFGPAAENRFDLTLSGHTHGGQIGLLGRSLLEKLRPGIGWWGTYERRRRARSPSRLYTTSGFGHWFPFRVGCPTEMPVIVLERANGANSRTSLGRV